MSGWDEPGVGPEEEDAVLAAEYVLRLLGPQEAAAAEARERRDPGFAAQVAAWRAHFAAWDAETAPVTPSPALRDAVERRLFGARPSAWRRAWESARFWRRLATTAAAGTAALAFVHFTAHQPLPGEHVPRLVSALETVDATQEAEFLALVEPRAAALHITRVAGEAGAGREFQLWLVEEDAAPVSLGVLPERRAARVRLSAELAARVTAGATLAITDEPEGGSPTGAPTGDVVAVGALYDL